MVKYDVTIIIPTFRRPALLRQVLTALNQMRPVSAKTEVVVVDNADDADTEAAVLDKTWNLPTRLLKTPIQGKNQALNVGVSQSRSDLLVFLDDDVMVAPDYLEEVLAGVNRWPNAAGFGGKVLLKWPDSHPNGVNQYVIDYVKSFAFGALDYPMDEGYFEDEGPRRGTPIGNNMILRRESLPGDKPFDTTCGPGKGAYRMGGGQPLFNQFRLSGKKLVYLPGAIVGHVVREDQLSYEWILNRSFSYGRSVNYFKGNYRGISGDSSVVTLGLQWAIRCLRDVVMFARGKDYPQMWAKIDRKIIEGVFYDRLKSMDFSSANRGY